LGAVAGHEALTAFSRLARPPDLDAALARWPDPLPAGMTIAELPIPRFGGLRTAAYARIGAAAFEVEQGRPERPEQMVREVISVGFLLGDHGPTLIENLIGHTIVRTGGVALGAVGRGGRPQR
jgi:hypothetical protein